MGGRCQVAKATYRDILERRARENAVDFVEGVATALTPIAFFETFMVKSYETLVDSDTRVDVNTGIVAASRLQAVIGSRDYSIDIAEMAARFAITGRCSAPEPPTGGHASLVLVDCREWTRIVPPSGRDRFPPQGRWLSYLREVSALRPTRCRRR